MSKQLGALLGVFGLLASLAQAQLVLKPDDVVLLAGGTNMVRLQQAGHFEAILTDQSAKLKPRFRDLSWEADTVFRQGTIKERWRKDGFGERNEQFKRLGATLVIAQFGRIESMAGEAGLARFVKGYNDLISGYQTQAKRVVLVSPTPFEKPPNPLVPDVSMHNGSLALYVAATKKIAAERSLLFVDLFTGAKAGLTDNGMHIRPEYQRHIAEVMAKQLGITPATEAELEGLRAAVVEKHRLWINYWRPANWKLLYGDDSERQFTKPSPGHVPFREEWKRLLPMIDKAEQRVWTVAAGGKDPGDSRPKPEVLHGEDAANIAEELKAFTVPDGLKVNLFASEKEGLTSPLAIRWDTAGLAYVTVTTTYPHVFPGDIPNDKIIVLEDSNGDGEADKSTVFAEGLNIPTGIELGDGGVYVGQDTEILFLKDSDGDGKADLRRVVLGGFGNGDSHQTINSFVWSPGGELFMGQGDGIESRVETPWGSADLYQSGFYRFRPKRLQLQPLLDDFMGPGNPWGVAFDDWGQIISVDGAGGVTHLSLGQIPTTHKLRLELLGTPGGYAGITHLDGRHLPKKFHGQFAIGDYKPNRVKCFSVAATGAGFQLKWEQDLLHSKHRNFRPIDVRMGPDGAVYVVDWYNPIACHQDDKYRDPTRDKAHGRIWRISSSQPKVQPPKIAQAPVESVLDALKAPERWTRYQAKRELTTRDANEVATALGRWVANLKMSDARYEHHLYEALGAYAMIEVIEPGLLRKLAIAKDPRARAFAARIAGRWGDRYDGSLDLLGRLVEDENAQVRMEAVAAAAALPSANAITVVARAADHPLDKSMEYVFTQAIHHLKALWEPAFKQGNLRFAKPSHLAAVLNKGGGKGLIDGLRRVADSKDHDPETRIGAIATLISVGGPKEVTQYGLNADRFTRDGQYDAATHAGVLAELIKSVQKRNVKADGDPADALNKMISSSHAELQSNALSLAGLWQVRGTADAVESIASKSGAETAVRRAAFIAMARMGLDGADKTLNQLAAKPNTTPLRAAAIEALCLIETESAAKHAATLFAGVKGATLNPTPVLNAFLSREGGAAALANALGATKMEAAFAGHVLQSLYATGRNDEQLIAVLKKSAGISGKGQPYSLALVQKLVADSKTQGDAARGKALAASCIACHKFGQVGGVIGPDLTAIGTTLSADRITEELLWPSRQVKEGYTLLQVTTKDGKLHQGFERRTKESEETGDLVMRQLAIDVIVTIKKDQIASVQKLGSAMPAGLTTAMTRQQQLDLIQYLSSLSGEPVKE